MAKVKFVIVTIDEQEGLPGTDTVSRPRNLDLGVLHLEDKAIIPTLKGIKIQAGTDEKVQAWKKEHGIDGWMLCHEENGSSKRSFGAIPAPEVEPEAKSTRKRTKAMKDADESGEAA